MGRISHQYQIVNCSNAMWIANSILVERVEGLRHNEPGNPPWDIDKGVVDHDNLININNIWNAEIKSIFVCTWISACLHDCQLLKDGCIFLTSTYAGE